uniref:Peroxisomal membrane protein mpv17 and related proteins n=1 Tax=Tetraselmis sp. GSL018 TaxID=582737 RepID=A0A061S9W5_9CHLO
MLRHPLLFRLRPLSVDTKTRKLERFTVGSDKKASPSLLCRATSEVSPVAHLCDGLQVARPLFDSAVQNHPLITKMFTSGVTYAVGDSLAQKRGGKPFDSRRCYNFTISGTGGGALWSWWYDILDRVLSEIKPGAESVALSIVAEQFVWAPFFFGLYFIPFSTLLRGASISEIPADLKREFAPTFWSNAKVWTLLNILVYNVPLETRVFASNFGELIWSTYLSFLIQNDCEQGDEICAAEQSDVFGYWRQLKRLKSQGSVDDSSFRTEAISSREDHTRS